MRLTSFLTLAAALIPLTLARFDEEKSIAVYWGQSETGTTQMDLSFYCQSDSIDTIVLAFISKFGKNYLDSDENPDGFELNLSNMCGEDEYSHMKCPQVEKDIKTCQGLGKKVLISLGGESEPGNQEYGFDDDYEAREFAKVLWDYFGEGSAENRPFGSAIVDGFDFDIETEDQIGYVALANELKDICDQEGTKTYKFTAAPQCQLPEKHIGDLIENFELDDIYVQFYNNKECELGSGGYNFADWANVVKRNGHNNTKLYIGLPSARKAAGSGFKPNVQDLYDAYTVVNSSTVTKETFGGFMFWDACRGFDSKQRDSYEDSYIFRVWSTFNDTEVETVSSGSSISFGESAPQKTSPATPTPTPKSSSSGERTRSSSSVAFLVFFATLVVASTL